MAEQEAWKRYEQVAIYILDELAAHFGISHAEGKQDVPGLRSGTVYEIDGKGISQNGEAFIVIECRCYNSKLKQKDACALAYEIQDIGAKGGIIVTPIGLQKGAQKVAAAANIKSVRLNADATPQQFVLEFLGDLFVRVLGQEMKAEGYPPGVNISVKLSS